MYGEMAGVLRSQKQQLAQYGGGAEKKGRKRGEIQLSYEDAVFYGHSKADALVAHRNRTLIFIKTTSNTNMVKDIFEFSH